MKRIIYPIIVCFISLISMFPCAAQLNTTLPLVTENHSYTASTEDTFKLEGLVFTPVATVYIYWDHIQEQFSVYGNTTVMMGGGKVHVSFGTESEPLLYLTADTVATEVELMVTDSFAFKGLPFSAIPDSTDFRYDIDNDQFEISGFAKMFMNNKHYLVDLGKNNSPGVIDKNNALKRVVVKINNSFDMHGLAAGLPNLVLSWFPSRPTNTYYGHGDISVFVQDGYYHASVGTNTDPGFTVVNGKVTDATLKVGGGAFLFGALPTYGTFKMKYNRSRSRWEILGDVVIGLPFGSLLNIPSLTMQTGQQGGVVYHTNNHTITVDSATFAIRNVKGGSAVSLGGFQLIDLEISIYQNKPVGIQGYAIFPPGFALGANIEFTYDPQSVDLPFFIHTLGLQWQATNMTQAIPVGETGFSLVKISGSLSELDRPSQLTFTDTAGFVFGELVEVSIPGVGKRTVAPLYFQADATISAHNLILSASGDVGATLISGAWHGLLGEAIGTVDLEFGKKYSFTGTLKMPSDPLLISSATASFSNSGDLDLLAKSQLVVPHHIPIIGGKTFASVDGALRIKSGDAANSFAAGWTKLNLGFDHVHIGALFNMGTHEIKKIGAAAAANITQTVENDQINPPPGSPPPTYYLCSMHHDFSVNGNKPPVYMQNHLQVISTDKFIDPHPDDNDHNIYATIKVLSGDPSYPNLESHRPSDEYNIFPSSSGISINTGGVITLKTNIIDSVSWIAANHGVDIYGELNWPTQPEIFLTPGTHTMIIEGYCPLNVYLDESDFSFTTSPSYPRPTVSLDIDMYQNATILYSNYLTDSTDVTLYWSPDTSKNGYVMNRWPYFWGQEIVTMPSFREINVVFLQNALPALPHDTVYFYAVVNDHVNTPQVSESIPMSLKNYREISGQITMTDGTPVEGVPVILSREGVTNSRVTTKTDAQGNYGFYNSPHNADVVIQASAPEGHYFTTQMDISMDFVARELQAADWLEVTLHTGAQDNITANFELVDQPAAFYGAIYDTNYVSIPGAYVFAIFNGNVIAQQETTESGFAFFNMPTGNYKMDFLLPTDENGYHWLTKDINITSGGSIHERQDSFVYSGSPVKLDYSARSGFGPFFHFFDKANNKSLAGGKLEFIDPNDPDHPLFSITSAENGLVSFDEQDLIPFQTYNVIVTPPSGYHCFNNDCLMEYTWDGFYQEFIPLSMAKN